MPARRRTALSLGLMCCAGLAPWGVLRAAEPPLLAPNVVGISPTLVTSGQPQADQLARLKALGFEAVIYLAPPTVPDAVANEAEIVRGQGLAYLNIPITFGQPGEDDLQAFIAALNGFKGRKVLVHCQVNMRASTMTFLYRVLAGKESPDLAFEAVSQVWSPNGVWRQLITTQLAKAGIDFEPY